MTRIAAAIVLAFVFAGFASPAAAQRSRAVPEIGMLLKASVAEHVLVVTAFRNGLRDRGYVEGRDITIVYAAAEGRADRLPAAVGRGARRPPAPHDPCGRPQSSLPMAAQVAKANDGTMGTRERMKDFRPTSRVRMWTRRQNHYQPPPITRR